MNLRTLLPIALAALAVAPATAGAQSSGTIAYWDEGGPSAGVNVLPAAVGASPTLLAGGEMPAISPDGSQVAFIAGTSSPGQGYLTTVPAAGGTPSRLTGAAFGGPPAWSKDGSQLAYTLGRTLMTIGASGGAPKQAFTATGGAATQPVFAPGGTRLIFLFVPTAKTLPPAGTPPKVVVATANLNGSGFKTIPVTVPSGWSLLQNSLDISPSGRTLAISAQKTSGSGLATAPTQAIALVSSSGGTAQIVGQGYTAPSFSPSGTQLCANAPATPGSGPPALSILASDGRLVSSLGVTGTDCSWGQ